MVILNRTSLDTVPITNLGHSADKWSVLKNQRYENFLPVIVMTRNILLTQHSSLPHYAPLGSNRGYRSKQRIVQFMHSV